MIAGVLGSLLLALAGLAAARYLDSPRWIDALALTGAALGLAAALAVGALLRRLLAPNRGNTSSRGGDRGSARPAAALLLAGAAALVRGSLVAQLTRDPLAGVTVDFPRMALACSSVVWGAVALLWGAAAVLDALEGPDRRRALPSLLAGSAAVTLSLYCLAPLGALLGLRPNHWTLLGLLGLAAAAHGLTLLWRRLF